MYSFSKKYKRTDSILLVLLFLFAPLQAQEPAPESPSGIPDTATETVEMERVETTVLDDDPTQIPPSEAVEDSETSADLCDAVLRLRERGTKKPIANVNIFLLPDGQKEVSDDKGEVRFENIPCGENAWVVNAVGYERIDKKEILPQNQKIELFAQPLTENLYQSRVYDYGFRRDGSKKTVDQSEFIKAVGSRGDPILALENEAGFGSFSDGGNIILQGADPEDTRFYVNGHEVPLIFHSLGFSSIFIPEFISSVDLLTAGFGSEYGRTIGGNINLNTKLPESDRIHALAYVDLLTSAALVQGPIDKDKKHLFSLGGRISYIGPVFRAVTSEDDNLQFNTVPQFFDLQGNYVWQISPQWRFDLLGFGARDKVNIRVRDSEDPLVRGEIAFKTNFYRFIPRLKYTYGEKNYFEVSAATGKDYLFQRLGNFFFDAEIYSPTLRSEWAHQWNKNIQSIVGIDTKYTRFEADLSVPAGTFPNSEDQFTPPQLRELITTQINEPFWDYGAYSRLNVMSNNQKWLFSPNLRIDYSDLTSNLNISPRFEVSRELTKNWTLRSAAGLYYQTPQAPEVDTSFGNPNLNDVKATHYALTAFFQDYNSQNEGVSADASVFYKDLSNVVVATDAVENGEPVRFTNNAEGSVVGAQSSLSYRGRKWQTALTYTLLRSRREEPGVESYPTPGDQTHNFNIRSRYRIKQWELSGRVRYISGFPDTPVDQAYYDLDNDIFVPIFGDINSDRAPSFFQVDLRVDRKWRFDKWIMSLYVDVQNVANRANGNSYDYAFDYRSREVSGGIPILPTFGIKGEI